MDVDVCLTTLGERPSLTEVAPGWGDSQRLFRLGNPPFPPPDEVTAVQAHFGLDSHFGLDRSGNEILLDTARRIVADEALARLAWHALWRLRESTEPFGEWPTLQAALGDQAWCFYALVTISWLSQLKEFHRQVGMPNDVSRDTGRSRVLGCVGRDGRLDPGAARRTASALEHSRRLLTFPYFRLGRFEYVLEACERPINVYRNRGTREVIALAPDGFPFDDGGHIERVRSVWTSTFSEAGGFVRGQPIHPRGMALRQEVSLPLDAWECVLRIGTPSLSIHIPDDGGRMTIAACRDSLRRAVDLSRRIFSRSAPVAFVCKTWTLDNQFESLLSLDSNLVGFQKEVYLFPVESPFWWGMSAVFGPREIDPSTAPRDTSLRRAVADHLARGGSFRNGGMFFLLDDVDEFGTQPYRRKTSLAMPHR